MKKILVIGSLNMDFVVEVAKMPAVGETILGESLKLVPGGKGANQAYAAGKLGGCVSMIGAVGQDVYGRILSDNLNSVGVNTGALSLLENAPTGNAFITVDASGNNSIIVVQGANREITPAVIDENEALIKESDIIVMQLEIPLETVLHAKKLAKEYGKYVIIDPAPAVSALPDSFFEGIDMIKPNETELQILLDRQLESREERLEGAKELLKRGVKNVIVTLGSEGCLLVNKDGHRFFESNRVRAVDTTAAGDCFTAAAAVALSEGKTLEEAIVFGNLASAISVTRKGAQTSIPDRAEVQEFLSGK